MWIVTFFLGAALAAGAAALWFQRRAQRDRDRLSSALRRAVDAERLAEIGAMTGGLAHEIKNPLSTIGLNAQLLAEDLDRAVPEQEDRERIHRRIDILLREIDRLRSILGDFLQFAGRIRLDPEPQDLRNVIDELVDFFLPQARRHNVQLRTALPPTEVVAQVDASLLKQALLNLMLNAVEAMAEPPATGEVTARELIIRLTEEAGNAVIHVIDTGPGMDARTVERVFHPYFSTKRGGTGLGLPTARRIVQEHGGEMTVHSEPGRGTDFRISLPLRGPDRPEAGTTET